MLAAGNLCPVDTTNASPCIASTTTQPSLVGLGIGIKDPDSVTSGWPNLHLALPLGPSTYMFHLRSKRSLTLFPSGSDDSKNQPIRSHLLPIQNQAVLDVGIGAFLYGSKVISDNLDYFRGVERLAGRLLVEARVEVGMGNRGYTSMDVAGPISGGC